jgi:hypothetical protein
MTDVHVEAARIPDRDRLLQTLQNAGLDARAVDEVGIEVPLEHDSRGEHDDLFSYVENVVMDLGAPFVPIEHDGVIYIRPPLS